MNARRFILDAACSPTGEEYNTAYLLNASYRLGFAAVRLHPHESSRNNGTLVISFSHLGNNRSRIRYLQSDFYTIVVSLVNQSSGGELVKSASRFDSMSKSLSPDALAKQALELWDTNASCWDDTMRNSGNDYWTVLEMPALRQMAELQDGDCSLDLATGNGLVARWLVEEGSSTVLATDGSTAMIDHALRRTSEWATARGKLYENKATFEQLNLVDSDEVDQFIRKQSEMKVS